MMIVENAGDLLNVIWTDLLFHLLSEFINYWEVLCFCGDADSMNLHTVHKTYDFEENDKIRGSRLRRASLQTTRTRKWFKCF